MRIAYITVAAPYGQGESFVLTEIDAMRRAGHTVVILPLRPDKKCYVSGYEVWPERMLSPRVLYLGLLEFLRRPLLYARVIWRVLKQSGRLINLVNNSAVVPKALATARWLRTEDIDCIHVHWMSTPATMAFIISSISKIPCIATAHRWDIYCGNAPVVKTQCFSSVRMISAQGKRDFLSLLPTELHHKVHLVHMGIDVPEVVGDKSPAYGEFHVAVVASLNVQKGHAYVLQALKLLKSDGYSDVKLHFMGSGKEETSLKNQAVQLGIEQKVVFYGHIPHAELLEKYALRAFDCVLLASYEVNGEAYEGIPVSLLEAMAYEIPVIGTDSGGISELVTGGSGILIPQKDAGAIAEAILQLKNDAAYAKKIARQGRLRVESDFSNNIVVDQLEKLMLAVK
jgi:glycosyltransferase involved in cell wall biosynthesis